MKKKGNVNDMMHKSGRLWEKAPFAGSYDAVIIGGGIHVNSAVFPRACYWGADKNPGGCKFETPNRTVYLCGHGI